MKPYILTEKDKATYGGISGQFKFALTLYAVGFILYIIVFSSIHVFIKILFGICILFFFVAKKFHSPETSEEAILLKIDENGIFLYDSITKNYNTISWGKIEKVNVDAGRTQVSMNIITQKTTYYFNLTNNGLVRYYTFRHKLRSFADDKRKIICPLTNSGF